MVVNLKQPYFVPVISNDMPKKGYTYYSKTPTDNIIKMLENGFVYTTEDNLYLVNREGKIFSIRANKFMKETYSFGYALVFLSLPNQRIKRFIHRIVATAFIPNPENKPEINHRDGNKLNNDVSNLEWATRSENELHAHATGLKTESNLNVWRNKKGVSISYKFLS